MPPPSSSPSPPHDVFQKGLIRGSARSSFDPAKSYAYVEHPTEGWRVYLRSCVFLHPKDVAVDRRTPFLVVKRRGAKPSAATWEPPKGQMEGKDIRQGGSILDLLKENVRRETEEESHVTRIDHLRHTGLIFQGREADYPPHTYFQYHLFQGVLSPAQIQQSFDTFEWIQTHPAGFDRWKRDRKEKDAVAWYSAKHTPLNPRWCPQIARLYFSSFH